MEEVLAESRCFMSSEIIMLVVLGIFFVGFVYVGKKFIDLLNRH